MSAFIVAAILVACALLVLVALRRRAVPSGLVIRDCWVHECTDAYRARFEPAPPTPQEPEGAK